MLRGLVGALVLYGALGKPVQEVGQEGVLLAPTSELSHLLGGGAERCSPESSAESSPKSSGELS